MKRFIRWAVIFVILIAGLTLGLLQQQRLSRYADATPDAIAAATSDENVEVTPEGFMTMRPRHTPERLGVIFYPGAYTDIRGYTATLRPIAAAGYRVVVVPMPFDLAILGIGRAHDVISANPDMKHWVIMGHSVGGAAASVFAHDNPNALDGVVIWDSFPPSISSLAAYAKPVWHIHRAKPDGSPPDSFLKQRAYFPSSSIWVPIPGGIHMYFGSFANGGYQEDWPPSISAKSQHEFVIAATLRALAAMAPPADTPQSSTPTKN